MVVRGGESVRFESASGCINMVVLLESHLLFEFQFKVPTKGFFKEIKNWIEFFKFFKEYGIFCEKIFVIVGLRNRHFN